MIDPRSDALSAAVDWIVSCMAGRLATIVAVLAVAAIGLLLLGGRLPVRRGVVAVVGCFILFSASTIAQSLTAGVDALATPIVAPDSGDRVLSSPTATNDSKPYDPFAGAAVPLPSEQSVIH